MRLPRAILVVLALGVAAPLAAASDSLEDLFRQTREASDARTNLSAGGSSFPDPSPRGVSLPAALEAWLVSATGRPLGASSAMPGAPGRRPFLEEDGVTPDARVVLAAQAITEWQGALLGSIDARLPEIWPGDLTPEQTLALKLAVERGDDRFTLLHVVRNDLDDDEARGALFERLAGPARALREARGGAPALTIVNSDVDDSWIPSLWDRGRYERGRPYPGYADLLAAQGSFLIVLTARPAAIGPTTRAATLERLGLAGAPGERVSVSIAPGETVEILDTLEMGLVKAEVLLLEARLFPEARLVFDADSGQGDWVAALVARDLAPESFGYATIHDVRPWSRHHKDLLRRELLTSERLARIYRRHLGLPPEGRLDDEQDLRLDRALGKIRREVDEALDGPEGRLDGTFLASRSIRLFRNHAELALDLAEDGLITPEAALRVVGAALPHLRFLGGAHPFGYDDGDAERLVVRLERLAKHAAR